MTSEQIARAAHEINRAYCQALGDDSQPPWAGAEASHQSWAVVHSMAPYLHQETPCVGGN